LLLLVRTRGWDGLADLGVHHAILGVFVLGSTLLNGRRGGLDAGNVLEGREGEVDIHGIGRLGHGLRAGQLLDVEVIGVVEVRVHVVVLDEVLVLLLISAVYNLASSDIIVLRVHGTSHRVGTVRATEVGVLVLNDKVLHFFVIILGDAHRRLLDIHLHEGVV
jgi:hypothetical protein